LSKKKEIKGVKDQLLEDNKVIPVLKDGLSDLKQEIAKLDSEIQMEKIRN